jgi:hypothetical protein
MGLLRGVLPLRRREGLHLESGPGGLGACRRTAPRRASAGGATCERHDQDVTLDGYSIPARYPNGHPEGRCSSTTRSCKASRRLGMPADVEFVRAKWPDKAAVDAAVRQWLGRADHRARTSCGSAISALARGDWGVGSDRISSSWSMPRSSVCGASPDWDLSSCRFPRTS